MKAISIPSLWLVAVSMHLVIAWFSEGYYHFDEHFQIIEFANYKLQNIEAKDLPWEFTYQMRSGFHPFIA